jgi:hypothetical protein
MAGRDPGAVCLGPFFLPGDLMNFDLLVTANADVIAQIATALIAVGANVLAVVCLWRGALWVFLLVGGDQRYEYGWSQDDDGEWFHQSDVDPDDPNDIRNYR